MAIGKKEFVTLITNAIVEVKQINDASRLQESGKYNRYTQRLSQAKVEKLYSTINEVIGDRIFAANEVEIDNYKNIKMDEIRTKIDQCMIALEDADKAMQENIKKYIEKLVQEQNELREKDSEALKNQIANELIKAKYDDIENNGILDRIYKDKETLNNFFDLVEEYKELKSELKMLQAERIIIAKDLIPENIDNIPADNLLSEDRLNQLEHIIRKYIELSQKEVDVEKENFGEKAKEVYTSTLQDSGKVLNLKTLESIKDKIEKYSPRTYEKAVLQIEELNRLNSKTFKTAEVDNRIKELKDEIDITKSEINRVIRNSYKEYYEDNIVYRPISTRINNRFVYELGYENLNDFFEYGLWPTEEQLESLQNTRKLNQKEAEKSIIKIELVKSKYSSMYNDIIQKKEAKVALIEDKLTNLIGDWRNEEVYRIINNHIVENEKSR